MKNLSDELPNCFNLLPKEAASEDTLSSGMIVLLFDHYEGSEHPLELGMETWGLSCLIPNKRSSFPCDSAFQFKETDW